MKIYLVEFGSASLLSSPRNNRFASGNGFVSGPGDTPANTVYPARLTNPGAFERHMWQPGAVSGTGSVSVGLVEIAASDGGLDYLIDHDVDKRPITILRGDDKAARSTFEIVFVGTIQSIAFSSQTVQIHLYDRMAEIAAKPMVASRFVSVPLPVFTNPVFAPTAVLTAPYYGALSGWAGGAGTGAAPPNPLYFWDNARAVGAPSAVAFIQSGSLSQTVAGFTVGRKYQITVQADARAAANAGTVGLSITVGGASIYAATLSALNVQGRFDSPFQTITTPPFTATATSLAIAFVNTTRVDAAILLYNPFLTDFGVDASATNLNGAYKPLLLGAAENFTPPLVNAAKLIYQVSSQPISAILNVWEGGTDITRGVTWWSLDALQTNAPALGTFDYYLGAAGTDGAYFRLGSTPGPNAITAKAVEGANDAARTVGQVAARVMALAGVSSSLSAVTALDTTAPGVVGYWCDTAGTTVGAVLDALCSSVGAAWSPNRLGNFQLKQLLDPYTETSVAAFAPWQMLTTSGDPLILRQVAEGDGVPPYQVEVTYARNWTVQPPSALQGAVSDARKTYLSGQYLTVVAKDDTVWDPVALTGRNPLSTPRKISTYLRDYPDAYSEALRMLYLLGQAYDGVKRRYIQFSISTDQAMGVDLGKTVTITAPRFGFAGGRKMLVVGMTEDHANNRIDLFCWG